MEVHKTKTEHYAGCWYFLGIALSISLYIPTHEIKKRNESPHVLHHMPVTIAYPQKHQPGAAAVSRNNNSG